MVDVYVSITQASTGAVTATLWLDNVYLSTVPAGNTINVEFGSAAGTLCAAMSPITAPTSACPPAMLGAAGGCFAVACQGAAPPISGSYIFRASFSVCPAVNQNCGVLDSAASSIVILTSGSESSTLTTQSATSATTTTTTAITIATITSRASSVTATATTASATMTSASQGSGDFTGPAVIGVSVIVGLAALGIVGLVLVRHRSRSRMDESISNRLTQFDSTDLPKPPVKFEQPLPPVPASGTLRQNTNLNPSRLVELGTLGRNETQVIHGGASSVGSMPDDNGSVLKQPQTAPLGTVSRPTQGYPPQQLAQQPVLPDQYAQNAMYAQYHPANYSYPPSAQVAYAQTPQIQQQPFVAIPPPQNYPGNFPGYYDAAGNYHYFTAEQLRLQQQQQDQQQQSSQSP
ncbi:UNVERIFIED_CONTAM: hypothetical protein HDU68_011274 [Siphonaria sp. JEL0065]|nr:hypothetical protein HDU68_011274 [Siphonaria sp. JEL0065]